MSRTTERELANVAHSLNQQPAAVPILTHTSDGKAWAVYPATERDGTRVCPVYELMPTLRSIRDRLAGTRQKDVQA